MVDEQTAKTTPVAEMRSARSFTYKRAALTEYGALVPDYSLSTVVTLLLSLLPP